MAAQRPEQMAPNHPQLRESDCQAPGPRYRQLRRPQELAPPRGDSRRRPRRLASGCPLERVRARELVLPPMASRLSAPLREDRAAGRDRLGRTLELGAALLELQRSETDECRQVAPGVPGASHAGRDAEPALRAAARGGHQQRSLSSCGQRQHDGGASRDGFHRSRRCRDRLELRWRKEWSQPRRPAARLIGKRAACVRSRFDWGMDGCL